MVSTKTSRRRSTTTSFRRSFASTTAQATSATPTATAEALRRRWLATNCRNRRSSATEIHFSCSFAWWEIL